MPSGRRSAAQFMYEDTAGNRVSLYVATDARRRAETGFRRYAGGRTRWRLLARQGLWLRGHRRGQRGQLSAIADARLPAAFGSHARPKVRSADNLVTIQPHSGRAKRDSMLALRRIAPAETSRTPSLSTQARFSGPCTSKSDWLAAADLGALVEIENRSFIADRMSRTVYRRLIASPSPPCIIAEDDGAVAGRLCGRAFQGEEPQGAALFDRRRSGVSRHRTGVARGLRARSGAPRGCSSMRLEVREDNTRAINLYERMAYSRSAASAGYYADGATALRFAKPVTPQASSARLAGTAAA